MQVVRVLGASPERELAVMAELGHAGVLLQRQMGAALVKRDVFPDEVGLGKAYFHVAEFVDLIKVMSSRTKSASANLLPRRRIHRPVSDGYCRIPHIHGYEARVVECSLDRGDGREEFVLDVNQIQRFGRHIFIHRGDGGHRVSHHADLANRQRVFIFADGQSPVWDRQVFSEEHHLDAWITFRLGGIDLQDAAVRNCAAQNLGVKHAGEDEVVGVLRLAGDLRCSVHLAMRLSYDAQALFARLR